MRVDGRKDWRRRGLGEKGAQWREEEIRRFINVYRLRYITFTVCGGL